jgi:putative membrane protein
MIRSLLKHFLVNTVCLYITSQLVAGMTFANGLTTLLLTAATLTIAALIIRPIINILLLPLNLITFGLLRWVSYAIVLYVVTLMVPAFQLADFAFRGFSSSWFSIPPIFISGFLAFIAFSFLISLSSSLIYWILK